MSRLLINEPPLMVLPGLATAIGINEAIVLQQVHFWLGVQGVGIDKDGFRWVYNTLGNWLEQFPFWSEKTLRRTIASLKKQGLLVTDTKSENQFDKTLYYRICYETLDSVDMVKMTTSNRPFCPDDAVKKTASNGSNCPAPSGHSVHISTTETTQRLHREGAAGKAAAPAISAPVHDEAESKLQAACKSTWRAYQHAYAAAYGVEPVRNKTVSAQIKHFVQRVGQSDAPGVAAFFLRCQDPYYVQRSHAVGIMLSDAEALHARMRTNRTTTAPAKPGSSRAALASEAASVLDGEVAA